MPPSTGQNTQFTAPQRTPLPDFMTRQFNLPELQIGKADLSAVAPQYKDIYQQFNQSIGALQGQREAAVRQAEQARDLLVNNYNRGVQSAEQQRIQQAGQNRQSAQETQTANRQRIRAIGGAPSSAALELQNRVDRDAMRNLSSINNAYSNRLGDLENTALQSLGQIENNLQNTVNDILNNATMTLREKDAMIRQAQEAAAQRAAYNNMMAGLYGGGGGGGRTAGAVAGEAPTTAGGDIAVGQAKSLMDRLAEVTPNAALRQRIFQTQTPQQIENLIRQAYTTYDQSYGPAQVGAIQGGGTGIFANT